jgi:hypothetical protein
VSFKKAKAEQLTTEARSPLPNGHANTVAVHADEHGDVLPGGSIT